LKVNTANTQIVGPISGISYDLATVDEGAFTFTGTTAPPAVDPTDNTTVTLRLKFQGITTNLPAGGTAIPVKITVAHEQSAPVQKTVLFTIGTGAVWSGTLSLATGGTNMNQFKVYVKGPKHVQKKYCVNQPTESTPGGYGSGGSIGTGTCNAGTITLTRGANTLDFTGVTQMAGDLPLQTQNGVINSEDLTYIRSNIGSTDQNVRNAADINLDSIVNGQDFSLAIFSLSNRFDE
jgi:hypothetical protein